MDTQQDSEAAVTLQYQVTAGDIADRIEYSFLPRMQHLPGIWIKHILFSLVLALFTGLLLIGPHDPSDHDFSFRHRVLLYTVPAGVFLITLFVRRWEIPSRVRKTALLVVQSGKYDTQMGSITLKLTADGITHASLPEPKIYLWKRMEKIERLDNGAIRFALSSETFLFVPAHAFASTAKSDVFYNSAVRYWWNAHGKNIRES